MRIPFAGTWGVLALVMLSSFLGTEVGLGKGKPKQAALCTDVHGVLLARGADGKWVSVSSGAVIPADRLLVTLFGAECESPNAAVQAKFLADVGQRGPFPVLEAAARFHPPITNDLDLTLKSGIVVLTNKKKTGAAKVRLRVRDESFVITLSEPKSRVGVEVYGRHLPGPPALDDPKKDVPVVTMALFALEGESVVTTEKEASRMQAPPGPALFLWDNVSRTTEVRRFETLPDSVKPMDDKERAAFDNICDHAKRWLADPSSAATSLGKAINANDAVERKAAVVALGALDNLSGLVSAISNTEHADTRDMAVLALRHWLGRQPGQSLRLFDHLTKTEKYTPVQARNVLHLLNGIEEDKRRQPQTYTLLIEALNHSKLPVRELAHWHLTRLAPDSKSIAYDAAAPAAQRVEAIAQYRKLIPEGEVPAPPKKTSNP